MATKTKPRKVREVEPVTETVWCEMRDCGRCKGMVRSLTGDRPCEHDCHNHKAA